MDKITEPGLEAHGYITADLESKQLAMGQKFVHDWHVFQSLQNYSTCHR